MKTNRFLKVLAFVLLCFVTLRFIFNAIDPGNDVTSYMALSQGDIGGEYRYKRMVKTIVTDRSNDKDDGIHNNNHYVDGKDSSRANTPKALLVDVNNLNKDDDNKDQISKSQSDNVVDFKVEDEDNKKAIKSILKNNEEKGRERGEIGLVDKSKINNETLIKSNKAKIKTLSKQFFSSGFGLTPRKSDSGENAWWENGVLYQPIKKDPLSLFSKQVSPRLTNYEPFIPFNDTLFFGSAINKDGRRMALQDTKGQEKMILWYTPARYTQAASIPHTLRFCPDFPCRMTTNPKLFNQSSLVVFNGQLIGSKPPTRAFPNQLYMFHNQEPPIPVFFKTVRFRKEHWRSVFNWTMTYRTDSTFPSYYGIVRKHPNPPTNKDYREVLSKKNGKVAWMVSHCGSPSKRDKYVDILRKYIDVDIYGACGTFQCERKDDEKCNSNIAKRYKFYLGFENGLCSDYVSEKFFRFLSSDIITVSRSMRDNLDFRAAPGTYIDTNDYESPKKLAEYLTYLDKNDLEYIKMLQEKDKYIYLFEDYPIRINGGDIKYIHYHYEAVPFCQVCRRLWNMKEGTSEIIEDIGEWFDRKGCTPPDDLKID